MSKFLDGPAAGVCLELRRAPIFLRVVVTPEGKWDALDQLDDEPAENEQVHVYRIIEETAYRAHVCRSTRRLSGWIAGGDYKLVPDQPFEHQVRSTEEWQAWVETQRKSEENAKLRTTNSAAATPKPGHALSLGRRSRRCWFWREWWFGR